MCRLSTNSQEKMHRLDTHYAPCAYHDPSPVKNGYSFKKAWFLSWNDCNDLLLYCPHKLEQVSGDSCCRIHRILPWVFDPKLNFLITCFGPSFMYLAMIDLCYSFCELGSANSTLLIFMQMVGMKVASVLRNIKGFYLYRVKRHLESTKEWTQSSNSINKRFGD